MTEKVLAEHSAMAVVVYNEYILTTQEEVYGKIRISLPKGHIESGETVVQAAIRECFEETNVILSSENFVTELESFEISFTTPSGKNILKKITPVLFKTPHMGAPMSKEERIFKTEFIAIEQFLNICSYENVKHVVQSAVKYIGD